MSTITWTPTGHRVLPQWVATVDTLTVILTEFGNHYRFIVLNPVGGATLRAGKIRTSRHDAEGLALAQDTAIGHLRDAQVEDDRIHGVTA